MASYRYTLTVDLDNDAFADDRGAELARILRELAGRVAGYSFDAQNSGCKFPILDINGNRVGKHGYVRTPDEDDESDEDEAEE